MKPERDTRILAAVCRLSMDLAENPQQMRAWWRDHLPELDLLSEAQRQWLAARGKERVQAWQQNPS